jgi:streptogramin lyase
VGTFLEAGWILSPVDLAVASDGFLFVVCNITHRVHAVSAGGVVSVLAGSGVRGSEDGTGEDASFDEPFGIAVEPSGSLIIAEYNGRRIRRVTRSGVVTTVAGIGYDASAPVDGPVAVASFVSPESVAVGADGTIYVADSGAHRIRAISPGGVVSTVAGSVDGVADGTGSAARFSSPLRVAVAPDGSLFVAERGSHRIRRIAV